MTQLAKRLSLPEAIGLSLSIICPSVTAAFNVTLVAQATGAAAPLAFAVGTVAMALIALAFTAFTHRVAHAGSAYAYIAHTFGNRVGFVAGSALFLTYVTFATGMSALVGSFLSAALKGLNLDIGSGWILVSLSGLMLAWWLTYRDMRLAGRLMLLLELVVIASILALCLRILGRSHPTAAETLATFTPDGAHRGWVGIGFGLVFCVLSFAGFEGAATLGEETVNPKRNIPLALFSTVLGSGLFFVFVAYCEVIGFGVTHVADLAASQAPLNDLALRYASPRAAVLLDLAAAASCFSSVLGPMAAAGRILFAMGRGGLSASLAAVHLKHGTPAKAIGAAAFLIIAIFLMWAPIAGSGNFYSYTSTLGTLSLILVYITVGGADVLESARVQRTRLVLIGLIGPLLLLWILFCNLYPVPDFPNNLWPYAAFGWVAISWTLTRLKPSVSRAPLAEIG